jgi:hypothetical protein
LNLVAVNDEAEVEVHLDRQWWFMNGNNLCSIRDLIGSGTCPRVHALSACTLHVSVRSLNSCLRTWEKHKTLRQHTCLSIVSYRRPAASTGRNGSALGACTGRNVVDGSALGLADRSVVVRGWRIAQL